MDSQGKAKVALTFGLYQGDQLVRRDTIAQDIVKVGKDPRSHLRVDDELASRMHAVIEVASPTDITLIDLGNEPGTLVNGQRVNKCKIRPGDQIQIGSTLIVLENAELAAASSGAVADAPTAANPFGADIPMPAPSAPSAQVANPFAGANPFAVAPAAASNPFAAGNPFAAPAPTSTTYVAQAAPSVPGLGFESAMEGGGSGFAYSMVKSGPDVNPDEVELAHVSSIEVMVMWDTNVLHVSHLTPPRSFYVGEESGDKNGCDYFIPSETLGTTRAPIVVSRGVGASLVILPRSRGYVDILGQGKVSFSDLVSTGRARPSSEMSGAYEYELPPGAKARMELEGSSLVFQVSAVNAGKRLPVGLSSEPAAFLYTGLSFLLHMGLVAVFAFFMPRMSGDDSEAIDRDQILMMQKLLNAAAEREQEQRDTTEVTETNPDQKEGGTGTRAKGEEGSMGNPNTKDTGHKYGVQGPKDNPDPHLAKQAALQEAAQFGMIGLISTMGGGDPNAPTAPWGREESSGQDEKSARGNMFGDTIGDSFGAGGLGLSGVGEGGGGRGEGIGLGNFGGLGHGAGTGTGQGIGSGRGRLGGGHQVKAPRIREGATSVNGRLPPEVIQRIVRQNFGRFRLCYENGMRNNPNLQGRVTVKFVIDRSGAVAMTADGGSDLPDQTVVQCVVRGFGNLSFPQPEGGMVTVVYPVMFSPGD
ncbi:MAG: AgmX/PglI C-terminal domain-containing protein [Myxococcota bacterium]|nr:AgmX/PglI C-terminal domain-containing protein [Myxococcota bacterium]